MGAFLGVCDEGMQDVFPLLWSCDCHVISLGGTNAAHSETDSLRAEQDVQVRLQAAMQFSAGLQPVSLKTPNYVHADTYWTTRVKIVNGMVPLCTCFITKGSLRVHCQAVPVALWKHHL